MGRNSEDVHCCSRLPWPLLVLETAFGFRAAALVRLLKRDSLLASHEPSVTTVFSRSPNRAWIARSLFASLRHAVRGLRRRVPIPARASSRARAWPSRIGSVLAAGTAVRLITGPVISRFVDRSGKRQQSLAVLVAMATVVAFGYSLPPGFAIFLLVSVARASALAPIVPIADAMTLAAAPGRFQYGWVRGGASAAFVVGAVGTGQVTQVTSLGGIVWMNGTMLALAAVAALRLPRNALDRPVVQRRANVRALFRAPGFLPLMALAALVLDSHALHDGFEVLRWQEGGIGPSTARLLWSEGVLAEVVVFVLAGPTLLRWLGPAGAAALAASGAGIIRWSVTAITAWPRRWCSWNRCMV
jgi:MFS transporter, PPP family, 3-phenylpropionic acid transporter